MAWLVCDVGRAAGRAAGRRPRSITQSRAGRAFAMTARPTPGTVR
ncbi:hypothetical protein ppKF707_5376 [Metapseudomonas furukawaii]|uniref:Uncharacterized protein n=1 Tax=Metapseudomonas furukawaii TaxID=1149133 RepID=A0AAD1C595_METFU|nr:hypothetical protein ppKF707_5376 [Pseudomonas furukawaii]BAU77312.1 hypothetical protein KF707C_56240 [Pseudomonas furukawaii]